MIDYKNTKITKQDILWILKNGGITIMLIMGLGMIFLFMSPTFHLLYKQGSISEEQLNLILFSQMGISLGIIFWWIIHTTLFKQNKCHKCGELIP